MNKYLVAYVRTGIELTISSTIVQWDCISQDNINTFQGYNNTDTNRWKTIIAITKLDK